MKLSLPTGRPVRLSFDWWVRGLEGRAGQNLQMMGLRRKNDQVVIQRVCDNDAGTTCAWTFTLGLLDAAGGARFTPLELGPNLPSERGWTRVVLEAKFDADDGYVALGFDGTDAATFRGLTASRPVAADETTSVTVGAGTLAGVNGSTDMLIDNVVVEIL